MNLNLSKCVALVTGAGSGMGEAVALSLAEEGVSLAVAARRQDRLATLAEAARKSDASVVRAFHFDQSQESAGTKLISEITAALGPIDVLIVNGGGPKVE